MTCSTPAAAIRESRWVRNGSPAVGSIGLGAERVSGRSRVPLPPTSTTASTLRDRFRSPGPTSRQFPPDLRTAARAWTRAPRIVHRSGARHQPICLLVR
jgi:hypothetical protein